MRLWDMLNCVLVGALADLVLILFLNLLKDSFIDAFDQWVITLDLGLVSFIHECLVESDLILLLQLME